ncbi:MAG: hypothetical protein HGA77_00180 [Chlorobiaceae bacterium]|nr:hypothetical protein [Chlorobiaceae bacterium]
MALHSVSRKEGVTLFVWVTGSDEGLIEVRHIIQDMLDKGVRLNLCDETEIITCLDTPWDVRYRDVPC